MSDGSLIEWCTTSWNPVRGCTKVSTGCKNCYAERIAERFRGVKGSAYEQGFDLRLVPEKLDEPLRWRKPRIIFVNSMSDLFHEDVPFEFVAEVFTTMAMATHHRYIILTKRPRRLVEFYKWNYPDGDPACAHVCVADWLANWGHVCFGISAETQAECDRRVSYLLAVPARHRMISAEPLLGPIDMSDALSPRAASGNDDEVGPPKLDWVIVGGESGAGARPMHPDWVRSIRDQCRQADVPFFFKQWGGANKKKTGRELDGRTWNETCWSNPYEEVIEDGT